MTDPLMRQTDFEFSKSFGTDVVVSVKQSITFPLRHTTSMVFHHIIERYNIPEFAHDPLLMELKKFIEQERNRDFLKLYSEALDELTDGSIDVNELCGQLDQAYRKHVSTYAEPNFPDDDGLFGQAYHRVVHSADAEELMRLEQSFSLAVSTEVDKKNAVLKRMDEELIKNTEIGLQKLGPDIPQTITQMQGTHIRNRELVESQWNSCISELKRIQRRDLRAFVMSIEERRSSSGTGYEPTTPPVIYPMAELPGTKGHPKTPQRTTAERHNEPWSQSFTVQLGRQLRTTCNFRLIRADPMSLLNNLGFLSKEFECLDQPNSPADDLAERLSNALGLYSNELNGMVVIVDKRINSFRGINRRLAEACERSTEFHFPDLDCQLASVQETINRLGPRLPGAVNDDTLAVACPAVDSGQSGKSREPAHGDVYITKHSNLAGGIGGLAGGGGGISVIFHLVQDESPDQDEGRIRSGTALHCSLSAILRACFDYDITTLSMPLLLVPSLREHMNVSWRARRAESVFKALKGALMDLSTWRGPTIRSVQFLAPTELSDNELETFGHTINASFLQPVPVIVPN
ncbi:hypothetical protein CRM22_010327 [Opisthorchis felineus]|uniref:Uncharacterized protein n=1 Tax=Opisthorchis felineus TaxID=147828 RepID=A0A4S2L4Z3_OPIFE|nr:hypothetical protein CRM22_010327 [Opisthorchis felineus]